MTAFAYYLLKVIICSGVLFLYYHLALRNKLFHQWNRFYLLVSVLVALVAPIIQISILNYTSDETNKAIQILQVFQSADGYLEEVTVRGHQGISTEQWFMMIYVIVSTVLLVYLLSSIKKILSIIKSHTIQLVERIKFINTNAKGTPFSFFNFIFWNEDISLQTETGQQIFRHELVHVKEKHSWDKLFVQLILVIFWCNPFFWLVRKELRLIHEFIADKKAVGEHGTKALASMILNAAYPTSFNSITNQFFQTSIKRRLAMLTKNQNTRISYLGRLLALPIIVSTVLAFTLRTKNVIVSTTKLEKQITVVIDAGHGIIPGGKPSGITVSDVNEDAIVLAISKKIKELNANDKIKIVLTRTTNEIIDLRKRVDIAKENNADLFVSLHIDAVAQSQENGITSDKSLTNGFGIYVSNKQPVYQQQSELLGSILQQELNLVHPTNPYLLKRKVGIWVLDQNVCPSVLVECGFLTDEKDREFITKENNQNAVAQRILGAIERFALNQKTNADNLQPKFPGDTAIIQTDNYNGDKYYAVRINGVLQELLINDNPVPKNQLTKYEPTVDKIKQILLLRKEKVRHNYEQDIQENKRPLYIVDGKEYSGSLEDIKVNDIESITVLKGDSAKSKYGDKGQNGIIEIRLKKQIIHPDVTFNQSGRDIGTGQINPPSNTFHGTITTTGQINPSSNTFHGTITTTNNIWMDSVPRH